jgi:hypothetical protein
MHCQRGKEKALPEVTQSGWSVCISYGCEFWVPTRKNSHLEYLMPKKEGKIPRKIEYLMLGASTSMAFMFEWWFLPSRNPASLEPLKAISPVCLQAGQSLEHLAFFFFNLSKEFSPPQLLGSPTQSHLPQCNRKEQ